MTPGRMALVAGLIFAAGITGAGAIASLILMPFFSGPFGVIAITLIIGCIASLVGLFTFVPEFDPWDKT